MTNLFEPVGQKSQREIVADLFRGQDFGYLVSYAELEDALGYDVRQKSRNAVHAASRTLQRECNRTLEAVDGVGYRIAHPGQHIVLASNHQKKARRQIAKGINLTESADRSVMTSTDQTRLDALETILRRQRRELNRIDADVKEVKETVSRHEEKTVQLEKRIAQISKALSKNGIELNDD